MAVKIPEKNGRWCAVRHGQRMKKCIGTKAGASRISLVDRCGERMLDEAALGQGSCLPVGTLRIDRPPLCASRLRGGPGAAPLRVGRSLSVQILVPLPGPLEQTMYLGELLFDLAEPPVRCSMQVPCFLGEQLFALKQH